MTRRSLIGIILTAALALAGCSTAAAETVTRVQAPVIADPPPAVIVRDTTAPAVAILPASGSIGVDRSSHITVAFDEPVRGAEGISLLADGHRVKARVAYNRIEDTAVIVPLATLPAGSKLMVNLPHNVSDLAGNKLASARPVLTTAFDISLASGDHTVVAFDDGKLGESREITLKAAITVDGSQRITIDGLNYLVMEDGPAAGSAVVEGPRSFRPGIIGHSSFDKPITISFPAGIYAAITFAADGSAEASREVTLTNPSSAPAVAGQIVNGTGFVLIDGGLFDGEWVRVDGATASYEREYVPPPPPVPAAAAPAAAPAAPATPAAPAPAAPAAPAAQPYVQMVWHGSVAAQQQTNIWCVPASVQTMLAMTVGHTGADQGTIYNYGRANMGFAINAAGLDPQAWAAALRNFGGLGYADVSYGSFDNAIYAAVMAMRNTNKPVGITINGGTHAWVLVGYSATADPATGSFGINGAYVVAPFMAWTDPAPGTFYSTGALRNKMTPYYEPETWTRWNGTYVLVQPTW